MKRTLIFVALLVFAGCGPKDENSIYELTREPISVRGWILDVKGAQHAQAMEMEVARRSQLFQSTSVWVDNAQFASGGIAENGAFIVLDVPPMKTTLSFNAPGAETAKVEMRDVPGTADVFIPDLILENGGATVLDPTKIQIRLPARVDKPTPTGKSATIAGYRVPIVSTPIAQMTDRREYPNPGGFRPVATVK